MAKVVLGVRQRGQGKANLGTEFGPGSGEVLSPRRSCPSRGPNAWWWWRGWWRQRQRLRQEKAAGRIVSK